MTIRGLILDVDGTIERTRSRKTFRETPEDREWIPLHYQLCQWGKARFGWKIALASNQGGVAFGYLPEEGMRRALEDTGRQLGAIHVAICFTHPKATLARYHVEQDPRRKPGPGMILECLQALQLAPEECLCIGDREEDEAAAKAAGCPFLTARQAFSERLRSWHRALEPFCSHLEAQGLTIQLQALDSELNTIQLLIHNAAPSAHDREKE